ncbi:MAG TPA: GntR family transcriptional regulator [Longimicrobiaceae bacterium]|nr:GntR family transcriptional regulator [Longimicrobiaceae bacterium]
MFHVDLSDPTPVPAQLERALRAAISDGLLAPGDALPTTRQLSVDLRVNANLIAQAYHALAEAGLVELRAGMGAYVRADATGHAHRGLREEQLRELEDGFLRQATALGFTIDEVIIHLDGRRRP